MASTDFRDRSVRQELALKIIAQIADSAGIGQSDRMVVIRIVLEQLEKLS